MGGLDGAGRGGLELVQTLLAGTAVLVVHVLNGGDQVVLHRSAVLSGEVPGQLAGSVQRVARLDGGGGQKDDSQEEGESEDLGVHDVD